MAKVEHYTASEAQVVQDEGAVGATIRWVIDEKRDGAPNYALRIIEVAAGGHTPHHAGWFEAGLRLYTAKSSSLKRLALPKPRRPVVRDRG